jgi:hypothetical protein
MNVKELKEKLNEFPDDVEVVFPKGDGWCSVNSGILKKIALNVNDNPYYEDGPHCFVRDDEEQENFYIEDGYEVVNAVLLF